MFIASQNGRPGVVQTLVECKAAVNAVDKVRLSCIQACYCHCCMIVCAWQDGRTPLCLCVQRAILLTIFEVLPKPDTASIAVEYRLVVFF
jgi:hypothetical protein